jgi:hypothetical protein
MSDLGSGERPTDADGHSCGGIIHADADQFERLMAHFDAEKRADAADMPTEHDALRVMARVMARLKELGWRDAIYCPKDGTAFDIIEAGSTGIHDCHYEGEWPKGSWWVHEAGDLWPSRPILFRLKPAPALPSPPEPKATQP